MVPMRTHASEHRPPARRPAAVAAPLLVLLLALSPAVAQDDGAPSRTPFPDVAPCHWAAASVARIAGAPAVDPAQARTSAILAENALRQVFEGLRCGDLAWSARFLAGVPSGTAPGAELGSFELLDLATRLEGERGEVSFTLVATVDGGTLRRSGVAELVFEEGDWRVRYGSLAALGLPLFP